MQIRVDLADALDVLQSIPARRHALVDEGECIRGLRLDSFEYFQIAFLSLKREIQFIANLILGLGAVIIEQDIELTAAPVHAGWNAYTHIADARTSVTENDSPVALQAVQLRVTREGFPNHPGCLHTRPSASCLPPG